MRFNMPSKKNVSNNNIKSDDKHKPSKKRKHEDDDYQDSNAECEDQDDVFIGESEQFIEDDLTEERVDINDSDKQLPSGTRNKIRTATPMISNVEAGRILVDLERVVTDKQQKEEDDHSSIPLKKRIKIKLLALSNNTPSTSSSSISTTGTPNSFFPKPPEIKTTTQTTVPDSKPQDTVPGTGVPVNGAFSHFAKLRNT
jgi:hypothetical protein